MIVPSFNQFGHPRPASEASSESDESSSSFDAFTVTGNPAATDLLPGSGWLGDQIGLNHSGWRVSGLNMTNVNGQLTGGTIPGQWTSSNLTLCGLTMDTEESLGFPGGRFGTQFLYFTGSPVNAFAGSVMGYDSLEAGPPRTRTQLYELWYKQDLFEEKLAIRIGKSIPTAGFNNVSRPVQLSDADLNVAAVSSAILAPLYVSPTQIGIMPGYYNSATGIVATFAPNNQLSAQYGLFDGNLAAGRQTGLAGPEFNSYKLHLAEVGANWVLGTEEKPGKFGLGYWRQTGRLEAPSGSVQGAEGGYFFASQRLYYEQPGESNEGLVAFFQFAATDTPVVQTHRYFGFGLTYIGLIPCRNSDSAGFALAYGKMNDDPILNLASREVICSSYYQYQVSRNFFFQPNLTYIHSPAASPGLDDVFATSFLAIVLF